MSCAQQYMRELPSHSSLEHSTSKNYKQNLQPLQATGKGLNNVKVTQFLETVPKRSPVKGGAPQIAELGCEGLMTLQEWKKVAL